MKRWISMVFAVAACFAIPAHADTAAPLPADGRLAYVQNSGQGCVVGVWDSKAPEARKGAATAECPEQVSVTAQGRVLVLVGDAYVQTYDIQSGKLGEPMAMPKGIPWKTLDEQSLLAGYTPDGVLALQAVWGHPGTPYNSDDKHLYLRHGDSWVDTEQRVCSEFDACPFKQSFETAPLGGAFGTGSDEIWNDALQRDPYVVEYIPETGTEEPAENDSPPPRNTLVFHVYGRYSKLLFETEDADDTDGLLTFGLSLVTPDDRTLEITNEQFDATIMGHYLLFSGFFGGGMRLYDLGDGKVVLGELVSADWLR